MKVIVRGKNVTITDAIEDKITKKLALLDKYFIMGQDVEAKVLIRTYPLVRKLKLQFLQSMFFFVQKKQVMIFMKQSI